MKKSVASARVPNCLLMTYREPLQDKSARVFCAPELNSFMLEAELVGGGSGDNAG
jgi:hypothetical protein